MKIILSIVFLFYFSIIGFAQITLTHNIGTTPIDTGMPNCDYEEYWARTFVLSDFGITVNEQFIIRSGQVAISNSYDGAQMSFSIFSIDDNFPNSSPISIGGGTVFIEEIGDIPEIVEIEFISPIVVPSNVEKILVVVKQSSDTYNPDYKEVLIAGTEYDNDISWFSGCREYYTYTPTTDLSTPVPNANFYINVTGGKLSNSNYGATTTLTHNVCDNVIKTIGFSCSYSKIYWARLFDLESFGVSINEEFILKNGQVAIRGSNGGTAIKFNVYEVDGNFPDSFSETNLIGSSQEQRLPYASEHNPIIANIDFDSPIIIPKDVKKVLVEVESIIHWGSGVFFLSGTEQDNDVSWQRGCYNKAGFNYNEYVSTAEFGVPNANFYINVTGNVNHVTNNFEMNISNICSEFLKEFSIEDKANVASVIWDFGDLASGVNNISTDLSPFHDFSVDGIYTITATVTGKDASVEVLQETIDVKEPPNAYGISDFYVCEDTYGSGVSSKFNLATVQQQVLGGQLDKVITFIDGSGNEYSTLPNAFTNTVKNRETIVVRVAHQSNPCCYSEITFDLIVNPLPSIDAISDLYVCHNVTNGFAYFDLEKVQSNLIGSNPNLNVEFYHQNGQLIQEPLNTVENLVINEEEITVHVINSNTKCNNETTFKLMVNPLPVANPLNVLIGCDDDKDGISQYFDMSNIETNVLGNQSNMIVSYFDAKGNQLPSPLANPYTNSTLNEETITVRVTNPLTLCFSETPLVLKTATQPEINKQQPIYSCDLGDGFANFDTSNIEAELIGAQSGLSVFYFDSKGNQLPSPLPVTFQNTQAWFETIHVRVENELSNLCFSETSFDLIVNELPIVTIEESYFLCQLEPFFNVNVEASFDTYSWMYQDGSVISNSFNANLVNAGDYTLTVGKNSNGIYCENSFVFELIRSELPGIADVAYKELSDANYIEINATGDGDFEYSIDGINYQDSYLFNNVSGGVYTVSVRDKLGCGEAFDNVVIIDYPKYFTPNGDGVNDTWQIKGIEGYPNAIVLIYDRYGKLLKQFKAQGAGWDGVSRGELMFSSDYWFTVYLNSNIDFSGHFALKR